MMKKLREYEKLLNDTIARVAALEKLIKKMPAGNPSAKKKVKPTTK